MAIRDAGYEHIQYRLIIDIQGSQEVFRELPFEYIDPKALPQVAQHGGKSFLLANTNVCLVCFFFLKSN
jgi:hypothetical protein